MNIEKIREELGKLGIDSIINDNKITFIDRETGKAMKWYENNRYGSSEEMPLNILKPHTTVGLEINDKSIMMVLYNPIINGESDDNSLDIASYIYNSPIEFSIYWNPNIFSKEVIAEMQSVITETIKEHNNNKNDDQDDFSK